jgi:hypothetical protein
VNKKQLAIVGAFLIGWFAFKPESITELAKQAENETDILMGKPTRGERNNNPGNIRPAGYTWQGQTGIDSGLMGDYVIFDSPEYGIRAVGKDLLTKFGRGLNTVRKIIAAYAPSSENDTGAYISAVSGGVGVSADSMLNLRDVATLTAFVYAIIKHENGRVIYSPAQVAEGVSLALHT